jgi:uncharacterized membrane protein YuzA (DUF378 family)
MTVHSSSPLIRVFGMVVWLLTSIGAINWGLDVLGYNIFNYPFFTTSYPAIVEPLKYIIGFSGVVSLLMMIDVVLRGKHCSSGSSSCGC